MNEKKRWDSLRKARIFTSLNISSYRLFLASQVFEVASMSIMMMVRPLLAYRLTESSAIIGVIAMFQAIPTLLVIPFAGVIADRFQKKYIMLAGEICIAILSLGTALALMTGYLSVENEGSWWVLAAGAVFQGIVMGLMSPSRQAIVPEFVGEEKLLNAASLQGAATSSMRLVVPVAVGFLIEAYGFHTGFFVMTGAMAITSLFVWRFPLSSVKPIRQKNTLTAIKEGLNHIRHERTVLIILIVSLIAGFLSMPYQQLLAVFADDVFKVGAKGLGLLTSLAGAGAVTGALVIASLPNRKRGLMLVMTIIGLGIVLIVFSASVNWPTSLVMVALIGLGETVAMVLGQTLIQYYTQREFRGRVIALIQMQVGFNSLGTFFAGVLSESVGVKLALGGFAAVLVLVAVTVLFFLPQVRRLD